MDLSDTEPCDDNIKKFRILCGEVYILKNIIECCKKILSIENAVSIVVLRDPRPDVIKPNNVDFLINCGTLIPEIISNKSPNIGGMNCA